MTTYNYDGIVIKKLGDVIRDQLVNHFSINSNDLRVTRSFQPTQQAPGARPDSKKYQVFIAAVTPPQPIGGGFTDSGATSSSISRNYRTVRSVRYQIDCLANYQPQNPDDIEASDLCYAMRELLTQLDAIQKLTEIGIYFESATDVRPQFTVSSENQFESTPSFDVKLTYNSSYTKDTAVIQSIDGSEINVR